MQLEINTMYYSYYWTVDEYKFMINLNMQKYTKYV